jgi:hypothetical protein
LTRGVKALIDGAEGLVENDMLPGDEGLAEGGGGPDLQGLA